MDFLNLLFVSAVKFMFGLSVIFTKLGRNFVRRLLICSCSSVPSPPHPTLHKKYMSVCMKGAEGARQFLGLQANF